MQIMKLNGAWRFIVDQDPEYHKGYDYSRAGSLRHWDTATVPGCWNCYGDKYDLFEGVAWFVREFQIDELPERPVAFLYFEGINYLADIFLNGKRIGTHEGGYTPFPVDASSAIQRGNNRLAVRVDNRHLRMKFPPVLGWYNYGGIHRDVSLIITNRTQIVEFNIEAIPEDERAVGQISIKAEPAEESMLIKAKVLEMSGKPVWEGKSAGTGEWKLSFALKEAKLWSPKTPFLYRCEVELISGKTVLDNRNCTFGIRRLEVQGNRIIHNGETLRLKGMCYLFDHPASGMTFDPSVVAADLDDLQAMGVNCLRSHFPPPSFFLDECDRRGIMLWLEVPIYCLSPKASETGTAFANPAYQTLALNMLREMVAHARNHPSVIIWSVGNECNTDHPEAVAFFRDCVGLVRSLDHTRLIAYASLYGAVGCVADLVDVIGINEYWGWYDRINQSGEGEKGKTENYHSEPDLSPLEKCLDEKSKLGKPLLISEFGADAKPGYLSSGCELWSEDYQALLFKKQMEFFARYPAIAGTFPFVYADYRDPSKCVNQYWHGLNLKGVVDYHRGHKLAWETMREFYAR